MQYYYSEGDQQKGPVDEQGLKAAGVRADTLVWREGLSDWQPAREVPELAKLVSGATQAAGLYAAAPASTNAHQPAVDGFAQPAPGPAQDPYASFNSPTGVAPSTYVQPQPYAQPGYPQQPLQYGGYTGQSQTAGSAQGMSVASLVLGILAIPTTFCYGFGLILAILAVIFGHIGHSQSKRMTGQANGMAVAGLICGYISLAIVVGVFLLFFVAFGAAIAGS